MRVRIVATIGPPGPGRNRRLRFGLTDRHRGAGNLRRYPEVTAPEPAQAPAILIPKGKGPHEEPRIHFFPELHETSQGVRMRRYGEAEPAEYPFCGRVVSGGEKGRHPAHGFHPCEPRVVLHGLGQALGRGGHPAAKLYGRADEGTVTRHGRHVLVPEVKLDHFRPGRDFTVRDAGGGTSRRRCLRGRHNPGRRRTRTRHSHLRRSQSMCVDDGSHELRHL